MNTLFCPLRGARVQKISPGKCKNVKRPRGHYSESGLADFSRRDLSTMRSPEELPPTFSTAIGLLEPAPFFSVLESLMLLEERGTSKIERGEAVLTVEPD